MIKRLLFLLLLCISSISVALAQNEIINKGQFLPAIENRGIHKIEPQGSTALYIQDFRTGTGGVLMDGWLQQNGIGIYAQSLKNNATYTLTSGIIHLPTLDNPNLSIKLYLKEQFEIESNADYGVIEVKTTTSNEWKAIDIRSGTTQGRWYNRFIDITDLAGQNIQIRFRLQTDESILGEGWKIEKVIIFTENLVHSHYYSLIQKRNKGVLSPMQNCLNANIISINTQSFPNNIYLNVRVTNARGEAVRGLTPEQFRLIENGDPQSCVQLIPPGQGGNMRRADIVFIMDNSTSLEDEQAQIQTNVNQFVDQLVNAGVDFALGLVRYGQLEGNGFTILEDNGVLTSDPNYFKNQVWTRNVAYGGNEPAYDVIIDAVEGIQWRSNSQRIIILITDESPVYDYNPCFPRVHYKSLQEAQAALVSHGITFYAIADTFTGGPPFYNTRCAATNNQVVSFPGRVDNRANFMPLVQATGGTYYPILDPFSTILNSISTQITNSYVISYRSCNPAAEVNRNLELLITQSSNCTGKTTLNFTPSHCPYIELTPATQNLLGTAPQPGSTITIAARVGVAPGAPAPTVKLWYRTTGTANYTSMPMTLNSNGEYTANLQAVAPGIDFYILAEGACLSSFPSFDPQGSPHQITVSPNTPLTINHFAPQPPYLNQNVTISAEILNNAPGAVTATLYYKKPNEINFSEAPMQLSGGQYRATIPASYMTEDCIEYFIIAQNSQGIRRIYPANGTEVLCETPIQVQLSSEEACPGTAQNGSVQVCVRGTRPPYKVTIGGTTQIISSCGVFNNLPAGTWNVYVSQNSCCAPVRTNLITVKGCNLDSCMVIKGDVVNDGCRPQCAALNCTGSIDITVIRGKAPFTFTWSHGADTEDIQNLCPGTYTVIAKDSRGCFTRQTFTIAPKMQGSLTKTEPTCGNNGSITVSVIGGTPPYQYALGSQNNFVSTSTFTGLGAGEYTVFVKDAAGCIAMLKITLNAFNPIRVLLRADSIECYGASTGNVISIVTGGTPPYTYHWSNGSNTPHLLNVAAGTYSLNVIDINGCQASQTVTVHQNLELKAEFLIDNNGCIRAIPRGGVPPYRMEVLGGGGVQNSPLEVCNLAAGTYTVIIRDSKCCTYRQLVTVSSPARTCSAPKEVIVSEITANSARISWNQQDDATSYEVSYRPVGGNDWILAGTVSTTSTTLNGLNPSTRYEVRVRSICDKINSTYTSAGFSTPQPTPTCRAVEGLRSSTSGTSALLTWNAVSNAISYEVSFRLQGATTWNVAGVVTQTNYTLNNLQPGRVYEVSVRAMCTDRSMGQPAFGEIVISSAPSISGCDTIKNFRILQVGSNAININYTRVPGAVNHVAEICEVGTSECIVVNVHTTNTIGGLTAGKNYTIRIRAVISINGQMVFCPYNTAQTFRTNNARIQNGFVAAPTITAYPNPTVGNLQVRIESPAVLNLQLCLINFQGQVVLDQSLTLEEGSNEIDLDLSHLVPGIYTLTERYGKLSALRIVKQ
ncbi:MAG: fibronectin type III domain-containing protein [Bacteroidia bacterium]|nr:fibronectin type III domain-containing protein [Bacteroidia bacterium]